MPRAANPFGDEDEDLQRVLIESMQNVKRTPKISANKDFLSEDIMNSSFAMDIDEEQQRAALEEYERNLKKNRR